MTMSQRSSKRCWPWHQRGDHTPAESALAAPAVGFAQGACTWRCDAPPSDRRLGPQANLAPCEVIVSVPAPTLRNMWERPEELWRRLKLGREEFLQRLVTSLIVGGDPPPWNTPRTPSEHGRRFLQLLDDLAHDNGPAQTSVAEPELFVDEYLLPRLEEAAANGWPDWAVLWPNRVWVIELKTEAGSHREDQLPYYLLLAAAAHAGSKVDLTYITGPLSKPAPALASGQRYSHLTWDQVLPLIDAVWGDNERSEVAAYVAMAGTVIGNLSVLRPSEQRTQVLGLHPEPSVPPPAPNLVSVSTEPVERHREPGTFVSTRAEAVDLLDLARSTAADGRQRGVGASNPTQLEKLRDAARGAISELPADEMTRFVLPWLWNAERTRGSALTPEGDEFGYELRFSRYQQMQIKP